MRVRERVKIENPLDFASAFKFLLLYVAISALMVYCKARFGSMGVYAASLLGGLQDVDPVIFSTIAMLEKGAIGMRDGARAIALAAFSNSIFKSCIMFSSSRSMRKYGLLLAAISLLLLF